MKHINKIFNIMILGICFFAINSCETTELNLTENPNELALSAGDPNLLLNGIQTSFVESMQEFGTFAAQLSRIEYMSGGNYENNLSAAAMDRPWREAYVKTLNNIRLMNKLAVQKNMTKHVAIGQVIEAYTIVTLVDLFGDIPYSEALNPLIQTPKLDAGSAVYANAITLLDNAIVNFNSTTPANLNPTVDYFYGRNWTKWIKLANSIKLKMYIQTRLVDPTAITKFNAIIASNNFIAVGDDFEFNWGISNTNPDSRHPLYIDHYGPGGVFDIGVYHSNWLMNHMKNKRSVIDPRMRYYFYRQVNNVPVSQQDMRCTVEPTPAHYLAGGHVFCRIPSNDGYWGRDHGNAENIPPDTAKRTVYGVYPAGGRFDGDNFAVTSLTAGGKGYGITPLLLASSIDFYRAEAALFGGAGVAKTHMIAGIQKSITKVRGFASRDATANLAFVPALSVDATFIADVSASYDAATSDSQRLDVIIPEFLVSLFGYGIDGYNAYRRTGAPTTMQPNLDPNPGKFARSLLYPASEVGPNPNVKQKSTVATRVFWDTNSLTGFPVGN